MGFNEAVYMCIPKKIVDLIEKNGRVDFQISKTASASTFGILVGDLYGYICDVNKWVVEPEPT